MDYTTLNIFDFDGTLCNSPEPESGMIEYEKTTGIPWIIKDGQTALKYGFKNTMRRTGWWGRIESLSPPILPNPITLDYRIEKVYKHYLEAKNNTSALNVMMTGRHMPLKKIVENILDQLNLDFDRHYFKGHPDLVAVDGYPKDDPTTTKYKIFTTHKVLMHQNVQNLNVWDDRNDFIEDVRTILIPKLEEEFPNLNNIKLFDVKLDMLYGYEKIGNKMILISAK